MTTPEQLRARLRQHVESLASALAAGQADPLLAHLRAQAHLRGYSAQNRTLVHLQAPGATHVLPASGWAALGRTLKPDARPLLISSPRWRRPAERNDQPADGQVRQDRPAYFVTVPVYDVSSTEGAPLREAPARPLGGDEATLQALLGLVPFPVQWTPETPVPTFRKGAMLLPAQAATQGEDIVAIVRTWAATELAGSRGEGTDPLHLQAEADCAAVAICEVLGVDARASTADHIAVWGGKPKKLRRSLGRITDAAERILAVLLPIAQDLPARAA